MNTGIELTVTEIQRFCMHDGPGTRTVVFLKGCPLRCEWCHNPETRAFSPELSFTAKKCVVCGACAAVCPAEAQRFSPRRAVDRARCRACGRCVEACPAGALALTGRTATVDSVLAVVERDRPFYGETGGLTVSGGEPTAQPEGLLALLAEARRRGLGTAVETCGVFPARLVPQLAALTDLFLFDLKDTDLLRLRARTGADLGGILDRLHALDACGSALWLRCPLIPGVNLNAAHAGALADVFLSLRHAELLELLPYHPFGLSKSEQLGQEAPRFETPSDGELDAFARTLLSRGVRVKLRGAVL